MLYEENTLTEDEAQRIIGEKMNLRIDFLNEFAKKYKYLFLLHSTNKTNADSILKDGVKYSTPTYDSRDELLTNSNITESDLQSLESYVKKNGVVASLDSLYKSYARESDTLVHKPQISAKTLLEYSHRDTNATVVFLVPKLQEQILGKQSNDEFFMGRTRRCDPYLRRKVYCRIKNGEFEYKSKYSYPPQAIAFIFDRDNNLIKINNDFDETYYFDNSSNSNNIQNGLISEALKNPENIMDNIM
jgi:hypothetical protein